MKTTGKSVAVLGVIILLGFVAWNQGWLDGTSSGNLGVSTVPKLGDTQPVAGTQDYKGNLNFQTETYDSLDSTNTGLGDDTELDTVCYQRVGDDVDAWIEMGTLSEAETGDADISIDGQTEMWCEVHPEDSQEYYIDAQKIVAKNDRIKSFIWDDADADNEDTYIFQVDLLNITPSQDGSEALVKVNWYVYDEETSDSNITAGEVASVGSVATGEVTTVLDWNLDLNTSTTGGDAKYIHSMRVRLNSTDDTDWVESKTTITLPNGQQLSLTDFDRSDLASTIEYKYQFPDGNDYSDAFLVTIPKDSSTEVDFPMNFRSAFESSDALCIEFGVRYINPEGVVSSYDTDDVEVTNDSVGTECTL